MHWSATNIYGVTDGANPPLHEVAAGKAENAPDQHDERDAVFVEANGLCQLFHGKRRVSVHSPISFSMGATSGQHQVRRSIELGQQTVDGRPGHSTFTSASGNKVRSSKMEIIGNRRRNKNMLNRKKPIVPRNVN